MVRGKKSVDILISRENVGPDDETREENIPMSSLSSGKGGDVCLLLATRR